MAIWTHPVQREDCVLRLTRMMAVLTLVCLMAAPCLAAGGHKPLAKGFGVVSWGEDVSKRQGFMKLRTDGGVDYFINLREQTQATGFGKPTVFYGQVAGKLYAVHLRLTDGKGYDALKKELDAIYGPGKPDAGAPGKGASWKAGPVRIKLKTETGGTMKLSFYDKPLAAKLPVAQRNADPLGDELVKLLPEDYLPIKGPDMGAPIKQPDNTGIDLLPYLKEGKQLLKVKTYN